MIRRIGLILVVLCALPLAAQPTSRRRAVTLATPSAQVHPTRNLHGASITEALALAGKCDAHRPVPTRDFRWKLKFTVAQFLMERALELCGF